MSRTSRPLLAFPSWTIRRRPHSHIRLRRAVRRRLPSRADRRRGSPARREIGDAVFEALSLTQGEREAVYEGVRELVGNRLERVRGGALATHQFFKHSDYDRARIY